MGTDAFKMVVIQVKTIHIFQRNFCSDRIPISKIKSNKSNRSCKPKVSNLDRSIRKRRLRKVLTANFVLAFMMTEEKFKPCVCEVSGVFRMVLPSNVIFCHWAGTYSGHKSVKLH